MKTYLKTIFRSIKKNTAKVFTITMIILFGVAFVSGLSTLSTTIEGSFAQNIKASNHSDLKIMAKNGQSLSSDDLNYLSQQSFVSDVMNITELDLKENNLNYRLSVIPHDGFSLDRLRLLEGKYPANDCEVVIAKGELTKGDYSIGDEITLYDASLRITGIVKSPLIYVKTGEVSLLNQEKLDLIAYVNEDFYEGLLPKNMTYVKLLNPDEYALFSKKYERYLLETRKLISSRFSNDDYSIITINENSSYAILQSYCDKIDVITLVFPIFFIAVAALVVSTTMTRMVEEERGTIGCFKSLGVSDARIEFKYVFFSAFCGVIGSVIGFFAGLIILPYVVYPAFTTLFDLPKYVHCYNPLGGIIAIIVMLLSVIGVSIYVVKRSNKTSPAVLMLPKAPVAGRKIFLERIPWFWNKLSFRFKACLRNIFRYKKHFWMTVISVAGSTALVFAGFAILDVADNVNFGDIKAIAENLKPIAYLVIIFALLLSVLVIYNLTNMNIGERNREIASLKVLGYHDIEVFNYIFREIFIMSFIGIFLGIPLGILLIDFILSYLDFGSLASVQWYSYISSGVLIILFICIVDLLLLPKILKVDMTTSLKSVE